PLYVAVGRNENEEAESVVFSIEALLKKGFKYSDMAIFYRVASLSRVFEDALRKFNVPYRMIGGTRFYDRAGSKAMLSYMQVAANPDNNIPLARIINTPRRGLGDKSIQLITDHARRNRISNFQALKQVAGGLDLGVPKAAAGKMAKFVAQVEEWQSYA